MIKSITWFPARSFVANRPLAPRILCLPLRSEVINHTPEPNQLKSGQFKEIDNNVGVSSLSESPHVFDTKRIMAKQLPWPSAPCFHQPRQTNSKSPRASSGDQAASRNCGRAAEIISPVSLHSGILFARCTALPYLKEDFIQLHVCNRLTRAHPPTRPKN